MNPARVVRLITGRIALCRIISLTRPVRKCGAT